MQPALAKFFCAFLVSLWATQAQHVFADEGFPEILLVGHFEKTTDPLATSPLGVYCSIFQSWNLVTEAKPIRELQEWLTDPWGFNEAANLEQERNWEFRLRKLEDKMRDTFDSSEDPLLALWQGMKAKTDPTGKVKIRHVLTQSSLYSKAKIDLPDTNYHLDPYRQKSWTAEENMRIALPVWEQAFVFGQFNSNADSFQYKELNAVAKTGLGVRWVPLPKSEVLLRGGPMVTYLDTNSSRTQEKSQFAVEVLATMPLWGPFQLEYNGGAFAATTPAAQNQVNQSLRIALPLSNNSEFYFGAKQQFDSSLSQALWSERRQVYIGLELKR